MCPMSSPRPTRRIVNGHNGLVNHVLRVPDKNWIITSSDDATCRIMEVSEESAGSKLKAVKLLRARGPVNCSAFLRAGKEEYVVMASGNFLDLFCVSKDDIMITESVVKYMVLGEINGEENELNCCEVIVIGERWIIIAGDDFGNVYVLEFANVGSKPSLLLLGLFQPHDNVVTSLALEKLTDTSFTMYSAGMDQKLVSLRLELSPKSVAQVDHVNFVVGSYQGEDGFTAEGFNPAFVNDIKLSKSGLLFAALGDSTVAVYSPNTSDSSATFRFCAHRSSVIQIQLLNETKSYLSFMSVGNDKQVKFWHISLHENVSESPQAMRPRTTSSIVLKSKPNHLHCLAFSCAPTYSYCLLVSTVSEAGELFQLTTF